MVQTAVSTDRTTVYTEHVMTADELRALDGRIAAAGSGNVPDLGALMQYEADAAAWLKAHGCSDTRCAQDSAANGARHADEDTQPSMPGLSAAVAYWLGFGDGQDGRADVRGEYAPFEADYAEGYADGQAKRRLPLATPVLLWGRIAAVVCAHNPCDSRRYQVTWWDRHYCQQHFRWCSRSAFELLPTVN